MKTYFPVHFYDRAALLQINRFELSGISYENNDSNIENDKDQHEIHTHTR